jgi:hypothetical protein
MNFYRLSPLRINRISGCRSTTRSAIHSFETTHCDSFAQTRWRSDSTALQRDGGWHPRAVEGVGRGKEMMRGYIGGGMDGGTNI